jgi:hypothetical protein
MPKIRIFMLLVIMVILAVMLITHRGTAAVIASTEVAAADGHRHDDSDAEMPLKDRRPSARHSL